MVVRRVTVRRGVEVQRVVGRVALHLRILEVLVQVHWNCVRVGGVADAAVGADDLITIAQGTRRDTASTKHHLHHDTTVRTQTTADINTIHSQYRRQRNYYYYSLLPLPLPLQLPSTISTTGTLSFDQLKLKHNG